MADSGAKSLAGTADKINVGTDSVGHGPISICSFFRAYDAHAVDLSKIAAIGFVEDLLLDQPASEDLYRWLSVETLRAIRIIPVSPFLKRSIDTWRKSMSIGKKIAPDPPLFAHNRLEFLNG
jgi:hypothetical protein